ncbi:hypothetical protein [Okeania sp. SIO1I7]|nr:hypothetical protein [Okeania sp. SIO1I7]
MGSITRNTKFDDQILAISYLSGISRKKKAGDRLIYKSSII